MTSIGAGRVVIEFVLYLHANHSHPLLAAHCMRNLSLFTRITVQIRFVSYPHPSTQGETGYIAANRIHDATYVEKCKLVYVHSGAFGFNAHQ